LSVSDLDLFEIIDFKNAVTLKTGLRSHQGNNNNEDNVRIR